MRWFSEGHAKDVFSAMGSWLFTRREVSEHILCLPSWHVLWNFPIFSVRKTRRNVLKTCSTDGDVAPVNRWAPFRWPLPVTSVSPWAHPLSLCAQALYSGLIERQSHSCRLSLLPLAQFEQWTCREEAVSWKVMALRVKPCTDTLPKWENAKCHFWKWETAILCSLLNFHFYCVWCITFLLSHGTSMCESPFVWKVFSQQLPIGRIIEVLRSTKALFFTLCVLLWVPVSEMGSPLGLTNLDTSFICWREEEGVWARLRSTVFIMWWAWPQCWFCCSLNSTEQLPYFLSFPVCSPMNGDE